MVKLKIKKEVLAFLLSSSLILSCSNNFNNTIDLSKEIDKKNFKIKSSSIVQDNELSYSGSWSVNGSISQSTGAINNTDSSLVYNGNWTTLNNSSATENNYAYITTPAPIQLANYTSTAVTYTRTGWNVYSLFKYNDVSNVDKYRVFNTDTDVNKIKYIYGSNVQAWSPSMTYWQTYNQNGFNYTYSGYASAKIEIPFNGTNISIYQYKAPNRGICNIKVYDQNNNLIRDIDVDNYSSTSHLSKTVINGLPNGNNKVVLSRKGTKNSSSSGYIYDLARIEVLPSFEYTFTGTNINYKAFRANNCGKVAITIDNNPATTEIVDLYSSSNTYQNVYSKYNLGTGQHKITVDAIGENNTLSSGYRINLNEFNIKPSVKGQFDGTFLNLKLIGTNGSGKADLYIDKDFNSEIDMYSSSSSYYSVNVSGLSNTSHTFELVAKNTKSSSSSGTRINFDGYTTNKASYTFTGTGIKYFARKGINQGVVDVWIDGNKYGSYNLYSPTTQEAQEILSITNLTNGSHTIDLIPKGTKSSSSTSYGINVDYLEIIENSSKKVTWFGSNGTSFKVYVSEYNGTTWTTPVMLSSNPGNSESPEISLDGNSITWFGNDGSTSNIYISKYNGSTWSSPYNVSNNTFYNSGPQISGDGNKIVWVYVEDNSQIYHSSYNGSTWSNPNIISNGTYNNNSPKISPDGNKIVWYSDIGETSNIYSSIYYSGSWLSPFNISESSSTFNYAPQISADGSTVIWYGNNGYTDHIYVSRYIGGWGIPEMVSNFDSTNNSNPQISANGNTATWVGYDGSTSQIYVSKRPLSSWSTPVIISITSSFNESPQINHDGNRIVWAGNDGSTTRIYTSVYNESTLTWSVPVNISINSTNNSSPKISSDGSIITWKGNDGTTDRIYASVYNGSTWSTPVVISTTSLNNNYPDIN